MSEPYRSRRRVEFRDTDAAGIMHFSAFFTHMEQVEHEMLRSLGLSVMLADENGTIGWPRVSAKCDYTGAVRFEEEMDIELAILHIGGKSVKYRQTFTIGDRKIAEGEIVAVCCRIDKEHNLSSIQIPGNIRAALEGHLTQ